MNTIGRKRLIGRTIVLALFVLPIAYVAGILSVAVHEIVGHGMSAVLLGGKFTGFVLKWDAMGWAYCSLPFNASLTQNVFHLASGVIATTICGGILLGLVFLFRKRTDVQLVLLVVSFICLMDGIPYVLWNSYHPVPPGDFGRIILLLCDQQDPESSIARWVLLVLGALLFAGTTFYFCTAVFMRIEELILNGDQFDGRSRFLALFFLIALPGSIGWFTFDWDQLAPGIGVLPEVVGALSVVTMAVLLFWYRPKSKHEGPVQPIAWRHITMSWTCLIATIMALALWFAGGVKWG
jgi:hypothetical protein